MGCKVGICEWSLPARGVEAIRLAARMGFDGIQITECGGLSAGYPLLDREQQRRYLSVAEEAGVELQALHLWTLCREAGMIHPLDSPAGKAARRSLRAGVDACHGLGIGKLMVTSGFLTQIKNRRDGERFSAMLREACRMGRDKGVDIVFESVLTPGEIEEMMEAVGEPLTICYDIFNPIRFATGDPLEELEQLDLSRIDHYHLKDGPENLIGTVPLGEGVGQFQAVAQMIRKSGYQGWVISENYYQEPPMDRWGKPEALLQRDRETMCKAFG